MKREFFIDNLLVRIHFVNVMIRWTGLTPWEFEFPFPGSLTSTFLQVKEIGAPRHKLVVQVTIGEVQGQGVRIASRFQPEIAQQPKST